MDKSTGARLLRKWVDDTGRKVAWVAAQVPVNRSHVHQWLNGKHTPRAVYRIRIEDLTDGAVPRHSWEVRT